MLDLPSVRLPKSQIRLDVLMSKAWCFFGYMDLKKLSDMDPSDDVPVDED